jgi:hypothetical protein
MPSTLLPSDDDERLSHHLEESLDDDDDDDDDVEEAAPAAAAATTTNVKKRKRAAPVEETTTVTLSNPSVVISRKAVNRNVRRGAEDLAQRRAMMGARAARLEIKFMRAKTEELHIERAQAVLVRAPLDVGEQGGGKAAASSAAA